MGNRLDQQNDLESVEICPKALPENVLIHRFSNSLQESSFDAIRTKHANPNECEVRSDCVGGKRTLFYFGRKKKRKKKLAKNGDLASSAKSLHLAESDVTGQSVNEHVQAGNGLVSLQNLNYYLESDTEFHLVNRILKRIGVFNRQTQTDFAPFSRECLQLIEVSQHLVTQLDSLNCDRPTIEELEEEHQQTHNEGFNMVYCGRTQVASKGEPNRRNVNVQRCISRATVGTNTVQSIAHLTICSVLARLSELDEQVRLISKLNKLDHRNKIAKLNGLSRSSEVTGEVTGEVAGEPIDLIERDQIDSQTDEKFAQLSDVFEAHCKALRASDTFEDSFQTNSRNRLNETSKETLKETPRETPNVTSKETSKTTSKVNSPQNNLDDYFWDSFEGSDYAASGQMSGQVNERFKVSADVKVSNLSNRSIRKSDTFISNTIIANKRNQFLGADLRSAIGKPFSSQPVLSGEAIKAINERSVMNAEGLEEPRPSGQHQRSIGTHSMSGVTNMSVDHLGKEEALESMDKQRLEEYLKNLLLQVQLSQEHQKKVKSRNAGVQTMNDIVTDELPEYAARTPSLRKKELIYSEKLFEEVDKRTFEAPKFDQLNDLVDYLTRNCENDIFKVRALFRWITNNMSFDWKYLEEQHKKMLNNQIKAKTAANEPETTNDLNSVIEEEDEDAYLKNECLRNECLANEQNRVQSRIDTIYQTRLGGSKEFVELFVEMCRRLDIRCKLLQGFAKNYDYRPGHVFLEEDIGNLVNVHHWCAVFVLGNWHLIDPTWATGYTDPLGRFQRKLNEFYFFTDPEQLIWSHFPFNTQEREYERWQLLDKPISLENFNNLPKITANFFEFNLKLRSKIANPINFKVQTEIKIASHEPLRYKYKLFHVDETENCSLNNFVFCQLKEERLIASFVVCPPIEGRYYLKVYTKSEREMQEQKDQANASLNYILTMLLDCTKARKYQNPYPTNELPYGPVQAFYQYQMQLINQHSAIISTFGGKRKLVMQCNEPMLLTYQIIDADGQEQDTRTMINRDDENSTNVITLNILPPRVGMFKLAIFGAPRQAPNQRGKMRLPLLATFLIDCRLAKIVTTDTTDPPPMKSHEIDNLGKKLTG